MRGRAEFGGVEDAPGESMLDIRLRFRACTLFRMRSESEMCRSPEFCADIDRSALVGISCGVNLRESMSDEL